MIIFFSLLACILPTAFYTGLIYWLDRYEREPAWLLGAVFLWGAGPSIFLAILLNVLLDIPLALLVNDKWNALVGNALLAPVIEESVKGLALLGILLLWHREIDTPLDGIVYGAMVGMGFAMVENWFYFMREFENGGWAAWGVNVFFRAFVFGLNHALFSSMLGLGVALAALHRKRITALIPVAGGWAIAVALHGLHNLGATLGGTLVIAVIAIDWAAILLTLLIAFWIVVQERRWLRGQLREEVALGVITTRQYELAVSRRVRNHYLRHVLADQGWRAFRHARHYLHLCSKLAYHKQRGDHPDQVMALREEIVTWRT